MDIETDPQEMPEIRTEHEYWLDLDSGVDVRVKGSLRDTFTFLPKSILEKDTITADLSVFKFNQATNYKVTKAQADRILQLMVMTKSSNGENRLTDSTIKANNQSIAKNAMSVLKNEIEKRGGQCLDESRAHNRNMLVIETPDKHRLYLRVKAMTKYGWQATINDSDPNPLQDKNKFWVFIDMGQKPGYEYFYIAPEHWVKADIYTKHKEYLDRNNGKRVSNNDSLHHAIKLERVKEWESRWDLLGFNLNIDEKPRPDFDDEAELSYSDQEGREYLRTHLFRERSSKCVSAFKKSLTNFECSLCGFDFEKVYGEIGRGFIEAHHIIPVSTAGERTIGIEDYRAVCSNCHRMIHRIYPKALSSLKVG
jgi:hypothetical protein